MNFILIQAKIIEKGLFLLLYLIAFPVIIIDPCEEACKSFSVLSNTEVIVNCSPFIILSLEMLLKCALSKVANNLTGIQHKYSKYKCALNQRHNQDPNVHIAEFCPFSYKFL